MPKVVDKALLAEIKPELRDLFEAVLAGAKKSKKYDRRIVGDKWSLGLKTSKGTVWCVPLDAGGSVLGIHIKKLGVEAASLRYEDTSFMYLPKGDSSDCACVVKFPDGKMKLTTYKGVLAM